MFLASYAVTEPSKSGLLGEYGKNLPPPQKGQWQRCVGSSREWISPSSKKGMVDYVVFALADDSESKAISGEEMKEPGGATTRALVNAIKKKIRSYLNPDPTFDDSGWQS